MKVINTVIVSIVIMEFAHFHHYIRISNIYYNCTIRIMLHHYGRHCVLNNVIEAHATGNKLSLEVFEHFSQQGG